VPFYHIFIYIEWDSHQELIVSQTKLATSISELPTFGMWLNLDCLFLKTVKAVKRGGLRSGCGVCFQLMKTLFTVQHVILQGTSSVPSKQLHYTENGFLYTFFNACSLTCVRIHTYMYACINNRWILSNDVCVNNLRAEWEVSLSRISVVSLSCLLLIEMSEWNCCHHHLVTSVNNLRRQDKLWLNFSIVLFWC